MKSSQFLYKILCKIIFCNPLNFYVVILCYHFDFALYLKAIAFCNDFEPNKEFLSHKSQ